MRSIAHHYTRVRRIAHHRALLLCCTPLAHRCGGVVTYIRTCIHTYVHIRTYIAYLHIRTYITYSLHTYAFVLCRGIFCFRPPYVCVFAQVCHLPPRRPRVLHKIPQAGVSALSSLLLSLSFLLFFPPSRSSPLRSAPLCTALRLVFACRRPLIRLTVGCLPLCCGVCHCAVVCRSSAQKTSDFG